MYKKKIKIILGGSEGRMGKIIQGLTLESDDIELFYSFDPEKEDLKSFYDVMRLEEHLDRKVDAYLDFTNPNAVIDNVEQVSRAGIDSVIATTGWYDRLDYVKSIAIKYGRRILYAPNFSPGVNVLFYATQEVARLLGKYNYDVAVREIHHAGKVDAPSGTAITLGNILLKEINKKKELVYERRGKREEQEIDVLGSRLGQVAGHHEVWFTPREFYGERLLLQHDIVTPEILGIGALIGIRWIVESQKRPAGLYNFYEHVLSLGKM